MEGSPAPGQSGLSQENLFIKQNKKPKACLTAQSEKTKTKPNICRKRNGTRKYIKRGSPDREDKHGMIALAAGPGF